MGAVLGHHIEGGASLAKEMILDAEMALAGGAVAGDGSVLKKGSTFGGEWFTPTRKLSQAGVFTMLQANSSSQDLLDLVA